MAASRKQRNRGGKKAKRTEREREARAARKRLVNRVRNETGCVVEGRPLKRKVSELLLEVGDPYLDPFADREGFTQQLDMVVMGWNLSVVPDSVRKKQMRGLRTGFASIQRGLEVEAEHWLARIAERKKSLFPDANRYILDFELTGSPGDWYVVVSSTSADDE